MPIQISLDANWEAPSEHKTLLMAIYMRGLQLQWEIDSKRCCTAWGRLSLVIHWLNIFLITSSFCVLCGFPGRTLYVLQTALSHSSGALWKERTSPSSWGRESGFGSARGLPSMLRTPRCRSLHHHILHISSAASWWITLLWSVKYNNRACSQMFKTPGMLSEAEVHYSHQRRKKWECQHDWTVCNDSTCLCS